MKPRLFLSGWLLICFSTSVMALDLKLAVPIPGPVTIQYLAETSASRTRVINTKTLRYAGLSNIVITTDTSRYAGQANVTIRTDTLRYLGLKRR